MDSYTLFLEASALWEQGQNQAAFSLFLKAAKMGDASSQHNAGYMYDVGEGTERNVLQALYWYKRAWKNDHQTGTCCNIASLYEDIGDARKATYWWNKAIELGDGDAALDFAKFVLKKRPLNLPKAINLLEICIQSKHSTPACVDEASDLLQALMKS